VTSDVSGRSAVDVGGVRTTYLEGGDRDRPSVVLVHDGGYGSDACTTWETVADEIGARFHWVAPDLIGHGGTAKLASFDVDPLTYRLGHLVGFVGAMGLARPAVVGASFGGALALNLASRRAIPLACVVSISGTGGLHMIDAEFAQVQDYEPTLVGALRIQSRMEPDPPATRVERRLERSMAPGHWETLTAGRLRNPAAPPPGDWKPRYREALAAVDVPVLLVAGSDDPLLETGWANEMAALIPGASAVTVEGARHLPQVSHPGETLAAILPFLGRHV
jgi:pimeloyl-ACP methyl ester carboxylesterase